MGGGNWVKELDSVSLTPESALSVENKIEKFKLKFLAMIQHIDHKQSDRY